MQITTQSGIKTELPITHRNGDIGPVVMEFYVYTLCMVTRQGRKRFYINQSATPDINLDKAVLTNFGDEFYNSAEILHIRPISYRVMYEAYVKVINQMYANEGVVTSPREHI